MEKECILGKMEENMKETISMIKNMDLASMFGLMVEDMRVIGLMESN